MKYYYLKYVNAEMSRFLGNRRLKSYVNRAENNKLINELVKKFWVFEPTLH